MEKTSIYDFLSQDHRRCDELFAMAEEAVSKGAWEEAQRLNEQFLAAMAHHLGMEEDILFPAFEAATGMIQGPTQVMRMEHEEMRRLLEGMKKALEGRDAEGYLGLAETLLMLMQQHNAKEEQVLYPMADRALEESVVSRLKRYEGP
ncbi:MAG: hemerythrin domain-containing protein [Gammaproteobacteria bacterium]|nr:MAG: hemerythrin domain-containing protein [Gammaproteobacteria bacterium]